MSDLIGRTLLNRYRVDAFVGRGGMAEVFRAWDSKRLVNVAIKFLNADLAEDFVFLHRFEREARAMVRLAHPHIVRILGFEETPGMAFMVMEYIEGLTLRRYLNLLEHPLTLAETLSVLEPVCGALHYAHQMGVYHCDVKPANIFIERGRRVVLGDFGIARLSESATVTFSTPGTPAYMSPEQCLGREGIDGRSDIYSLGISIYEALTLDRPFKGETASITGTLGERVRWEQSNMPPPSPRRFNPDIPLAVEAVILRALEKSPRRRQQRVNEFLEEYQQAAAVKPAEVLPAVVEEQAEPVENASFPVGSAQSNIATGSESRVGGGKARQGIVVMAIGFALLAVLILVLGGAGLVHGPPPVPTMILTPIPKTRILLTPNEQGVPTGLAILPTPTGWSTPAKKVPLPVPTLTPSKYYVMYVLDSSDNMAGEMDLAQKALTRHLRYVQSLDPAINVGLVAFGHRTSVSDLDRSCSDDNVEVLFPIRSGSAKSIEQSLPHPRLSARGFSPLEAAVTTAYQQFAFWPDWGNALVLIVGGRDNCRGDPLLPIRTNRQNFHKLLPFYIAGLDIKKEEDRKQLIDIRDLTQGEYRDVSGENDLLNALNDFIEEIRRR